MGFLPASENPLPRPIPVLVESLRQQEYVVDEILEDIYEFFTEKMRPMQKDEPQMDFTLDFDQVPLFPPQEGLPRQMAIGEGSRKPL